MTYLILIIISSMSTAYGFNLSSGRWLNSTTNVTFSSTKAPQNAQGLTNAGSVTSGGWVTEVKSAFSHWTMANGVKFNMVYTNEDCGDNCTINNDKNEMYWMAPGVEPINMPAGALAVTLRRQFDNNMVEVDIVVNNTFDQLLETGRQQNPGRLCILGSGPGAGYSNCFDFPSIMTHEIGHLFGLDHSSEDPNISSSDPRRTATMYYSLAPDGSLLPLKADDVAGMTCLYPEIGEPYKVEACCDSYSPFDRAPGCSHAFSEKSTQSLDVGGGTAGCGYIRDIVSKDNGDDDHNGQAPIVIIALIPLFFLLLNRAVVGMKKI